MDASELKLGRKVWAAHEDWGPELVEVICRVDALKVAVLRPGGSGDSVFLFECHPTLGEAVRKTALSCRSIAATCERDAARWRAAAARVEAAGRAADPEAVDLGTPPGPDAIDTIRERK